MGFFGGLAAVVVTRASRAQAGLAESQAPFTEQEQRKLEAWATEKCS